MTARQARAFMTAAILLFAAAVPAPVNAQVREITEEFVDLLLRAFSAEQAELEKVSTQLGEVDDKIRKFNECKALLEAAGDVSGSRMGGLAARAAIRARCGASDTDGFNRDRQKIVEGPEKVALDMLRLRSADYSRLKDRITGYFQTGSGFNAAEAALLSARRTDFASAMRTSFASYAGGGDSRGGGGRGLRGVRSTWTMDYAWEYIGHMFQIMYISGASIFEKPYQPGQWTEWEIVSRDTRYNDDNRPAADLESRQTIERAFLGLTEDGGEWWRFTSVDHYEENGVQKADTVILESLFKPMNEYMKQLARVRARLPGQDANELMVPQHFAMLSMLSVFPMKPTEESVRGATIGNERIGNFDARHVRFAAGSGNLEWWIADDAPGGWVRFRSTEQKDSDVREPGTYTVQMSRSGSGAKSLLGVM
jgi:hypothetical protein